MRRAFFFTAFSAVAMFTIAAPAQTDSDNFFEFEDTAADVAADVTPDADVMPDAESADIEPLPAAEAMEDLESVAEADPADAMVCETCGELIADSEVGCVSCAEELLVEEFVDPCCMDDCCGAGGGFAGGGHGGMGWLGLAGLAGLAGIGGGDCGTPASPYSNQECVW